VNEYDAIEMANEREPWNERIPSPPTVPMDDEEFLREMMAPGDQTTTPPTIHKVQCRGCGTQCNVWTAERLASGYVCLECRFGHLDDATKQWVKYDEATGLLVSQPVETIVCDECGRDQPKRFATEMKPGRYLCGRCTESHLDDGDNFCVECREYVHHTRTLIVGDTGTGANTFTTETMCIRCLEKMDNRVVVCPHCGEWKEVNGKMFARLETADEFRCFECRYCCRTNWKREGF
jgi:hypothetical protein